jgi:hypothetical protein
VHDHTRVSTYNHTPSACRNPHVHTRTRVSLQPAGVTTPTEVVGRIIGFVEGLATGVLLGHTCVCVCVALTRGTWHARVRAERILTGGGKASTH